MNLTNASVGLVAPEIYRHEAPFVLQCGVTLPSYELVYETYGTLNNEATNAILICHALSGHHHAAGVHTEEDVKPGWWDSCIGPGKPIDTNLYFVVSLNNIGGCHGSTGPRSKNPKTGQAYGPEFPTVLVRDWVATQAHLADHLGIRQFAAIVGGSLGGMQAMQWAIDFPDRIRTAIVIASAAKLSAQNIAFNEIARQAITSDPNFFAGRYAENESNPDQGLMLARMIGHVTYLSDDGMREKFGRELKSGNPQKGDDVEFQVESYLHHQGRSFSQVFDANTYVLMTKALDFYDPASEHNNDLATVLKDVSARFLVVSFTSDWRFSVERSQEIVNALVAAGKNVATAIIESEHGHDSFLLPIPRYFDVLNAYLGHLYEELDPKVSSS
ncbi:MAG: homoserine O-acetyltransferase [Pseudomonadales bacterium]|nr:homoserine O-acetyltransferase [Pseudomonadales bacterium]